MVWLHGQFGRGFDSRLVHPSTTSRRAGADVSEMAYGSGNYGDGLYGSGSVTTGYGSGLYGAGPYGLTATSGNNLFGPPAKNHKTRKPRSTDRATTDDDEAALALVLALL